MINLADIRRFSWASYRYIMRYFVGNRVGRIIHFLKKIPSYFYVHLNVT